MAEPKSINPILKLVLEIGPVAAYFFGYQRFAEEPLVLAGTAYEGVVAATIIFVPLLLASLVASWVLTRTLPRMSIFTAVIVVVFGGLTVWLNDDTFTKMRPTILYGIFATVLGIGLWVQGRSYLRYLIDEFMPLSEDGWWIFTRNFFFFFAFMAVLNEIVWRFMSEGVWVFLDAWGQLILTFAFLATQFPILNRYSTEETEGEE